MDNLDRLKKLSPQELIDYERSLFKVVHGWDRFERAPVTYEKGWFVIGGPGGRTCYRRDHIEWYTDWLESAKRSMGLT